MDIAIFDDDESHRQQLAGLLAAGGHRVLVCTRVRDLPARPAPPAVDLVLLGWAEPDDGARQAMTRLRERDGPGLPVIATAARGDGPLAVAALNAGADDCVGWPPAADELLARMAALARRARLSRSSTVRLGGYEFDLERRTVRIDGQPVDLTQKEYELAVHLFRHPGALMPRAELLQRIWGPAVGVNTRTVDTHASRVRRKLRLDSGSAGWRLAPVYGSGYRLEAVPRPPTVVPDPPH